MSNLVKRSYCYNVMPMTYSADGEVHPDLNCNGFTIRNLGDTIVNVSGITVFPALVVGTPGESVSIGGNLGEIFIGRLTIKFQAPIGANPLVEIIQKYYTPNY